MSYEQIEHKQKLNNKKEKIHTQFYFLRVLFLQQHSKQLFFLINIQVYS